MKIGIISINAHTKVLNFASPLHTYAFQQFLLQNGIESTIIDYKPIYFGKFDVRHPLHYYQTHPNQDEAVQEELIAKWTALYDAREKRYDRFEEFIQKYYIKTDICYTAKSIEKTDPGFLQERTFYENLAIEPQEQEYILLYIVMGKADELVEKTNAFAKKKNLQVIILGEEPDDVQKLEVPAGLCMILVWRSGLVI